MSKKQKFYSPRNINRKKATYNVIFGERSNGKTFALLKQTLTDYIKTGRQMGYVRRWREDLTGRRGQALYGGIVEQGLVEQLTNGEFTGIHYYSGRWHLCNYNSDGRAIYSDQDIIAYSFALSQGEHDKSTSFPNIGTIVFDEFLTSRTYLPDEFVLFMNTVSTIVRRREDVSIYMLGNTVNKYCPYFQEMGLTNVDKMKQGTIDVYRYGQSSLSVAVEYCEQSSDSKSTQHKYFAFNNPKLEMITGGAWELNMYPHIPMKYKPKDVMLRYFIEFNGDIYQAEVVQVDNLPFTFIHQKTTPLKEDNEAFVYSLEHSAEINYNRNILRPMNKTQQKILWFFQNDRVFYQDNNVGDAINNYLKICSRT